MLLTITTTHQPATDLGYLLHKHPDKFQSFKLSIGQAHVYYPESSEERCTLALLLDVDPIDMVRGNKPQRGRQFSLGQYVNDRPYVASSFLSVAIAKTFASAMNGNCKDKPELVDTPLPLQVRVSVLSVPRGGEALIRKFFEPLGYEVSLQRHVLDDNFPDWGESKYYTLELQHKIPLSKLLSHLYVLIPALDNDKHYFVSKDEINKLLARGEAWLSEHPEKEQIVNRYLLNFRSLSRAALERLAVENTKESEEKEQITEVKEHKESLHQKRLALALKQLKATGAKRVLDLGCGEGKLLRMLLKETQFEQIVGTDVSHSELEKVKNRLRWEELSERQKARIQLFQSSVVYRDKRLKGYDAAAIVEVIEHLDEDRLVAFERAIFEFAKLKYIILTTPNGEYNVLFETLPEGKMRHNDHRFEWTRAEFETWAKGVAERQGYTVRFLPIGEMDEKVGAPSQMAIFSFQGVKN